MDAIQQLDFPCTCSWSLYWGVSYPVDHYFLGASEHNSNGRKWLKKIQPNLSILQVLSPLQRSVQVILVVSAFLPRWTLANLMVQPGCSLTQGTKRIHDISSRRLVVSSRIRRSTLLLEGWTRDSQHTRGSWFSDYTCKRHADRVSGRTLRWFC